MLRKILLELILIRKELQRIQECAEPQSFDSEEKNDQNQAICNNERMITAIKSPTDSDIYQKSAWFSVVTSSAAVVVAIMVLVMR